MLYFYFFFFFSSRRRHTSSDRDWSSDVCSSDLPAVWLRAGARRRRDRASMAACTGSDHLRRLKRGAAGDPGRPAARTSARTLRTTSNYLFFPNGSAVAVHQSASEDAADHIREQIFTGAYPPYSRVPQDVVAAALGISRIPVREALVALEGEGFVTMPTNRGAFVNPFSAYDIRSHFELRGYTLGLAARRCAQLENSDLVSRLEPLYRAMRATDNPEEFYQVTAAFYLAISEYGASPRITAALSRIHNIVPGNFYAVVPGSIAAARRGYG